MSSSPSHELVRDPLKMTTFTLVVVSLTFLGHLAAGGGPPSPNYRGSRRLEQLLRALEEELNTEEKKATAERPNLEGYVETNCPKQMATLAQANLNDGVTTAEMLSTLGESDMRTWEPVLDQLVQDYLDGKGTGTNENYYQKVMCAMALIDVLAVRLVIGNPPLCEGQDESSLESNEACLKEKIADLKKQVADLNGVTDVDDAAADLVRIMLTVGTIRRSSWNIWELENAKEAKAKQKVPKLFSLEKRLGHIAKRRPHNLVEWIRTHCDVQNLEWESTDNDAITAADIQQAVKDADFEKWWDDLDDIENKKQNTVVAKASCSMAPLLAVSNRLLQGGLADVCEGQDVEPDDAQAIAKCISTDLADLKNTFDAMDKMTMATTTGDCAVQAIRAMLSLDRIADGLWLLALKEGLVPQQ